MWKRAGVRCAAWVIPRCVCSAALHCRQKQQIITGVLLSLCAMRARGAMRFAAPEAGKGQICSACCMRGTYSLRARLIFLPLAFLFLLFRSQSPERAVVVAVGLKFRGQLALSLHPLLWNRICAPCVNWICEINCSAGEIKLFLSTQKKIWFLWLSLIWEHCASSCFSF